jgi:hypothetical protein
VTSFPDTAGGEGNPPLNSTSCSLPEDAHRCTAAGHDVGKLAKAHNVE